MIDEMDRRLRDWAGSVVGGLPVSLAPPGREEAGEAAVSLYLLDLGESPSPRTPGPQPLELQLRYLVTTSARDPEEAHRLLSDLLFAALETEEMQVEMEPVPPALWQAFGVAPRPAFRFRVPLIKDREARPAPRVLEPVVVRAAPLARFDGVVLGPGDVPLAGARVALPALNLSARTDFQGRFHFGAVPRDATGTLRVEARGRELSLTPEPPSEPESPRIVRFPLMED
jgi:hypothetical protein